MAGRQRGSASKKKQEYELPSDMEEDVDLFHKGKDKVSSGKGGGAGDGNVVYRRLARYFSAKLYNLTNIPGIHLPDTIHLC